MPNQPVAVEWFQQPDADPASILALSWHLLDAVAEGRRPPAMIVYSLREEHAALGRFHVAPEARRSDVFRRFSGGRVLAMGPGFATAALLLPRADALTGDPPGSLSASQVLNRHVRGFLKGCRAAGIEPIYPGRDVVTIAKRIVAAVGLEVDRRGAAMFEIVVAVWRAFDEVAPLLDRVDPDGFVTAAMLAPDEVTDLEREADASVDFDFFARIMRQGYAEQLRATIVEGRLSAAEEEAVRVVAADTAACERWIFGRRRSPQLTLRGTCLQNGGQLDVYFAEAGGVLGDVVVSGDFIANADAVARLEDALRGCRREASAIDAAIAGACSQPGDFLLGIGPAALRDAILAGRPW